VVRTQKKGESIDSPFFFGGTTRTQFAGATLETVTMLWFSASETAEANRPVRLWNVSLGPTSAAML
jgi:hypothetical protein